MSWFLVLPVATALLAHVPPAEPTIEPPGVEPSTAPRAGSHQEPPVGWYGAPALAADGAVALGLAVLVHETDSRSQPKAPAVLYGLAAATLLGGPVVHLANGHAVRSVESLLLRVGALAAGVGVAYAIARPARSGCGDDSFDATCPAPYGLLLAPVAAMVLDDLLLARHPAARPSMSTRLLVQPGLALFGVGGTF